MVLLGMYYAALLLSVLSFRGQPALGRFTASCAVILLFVDYIALQRLFTDLENVLYPSLSTCAFQLPFEKSFEAYL